MKILFTICARAGSKGLKNKNIRTFCGRPLVEWTLDAYREFQEKYDSQYEVIDLALNTDSMELVQQMENTQVSYTYVKRKENLAGDFVSKLSVIKDTLLETEAEKKKNYDVVIDLDLTSPVRTAEDIAGTFKALLENAQADISFSVTEARRNPYFNMVCRQENGFYEKVLPSEFVSRQQAPDCYDMNASIYAYRREYLLSGKETRNAVIWKMADTGILDIDSEEDFELLELIVSYLKKKRKK